MKQWLATTLIRVAAGVAIIVLSLAGYLCSLLIKRK